MKYKSIEDYIVKHVEPSCKTYEELIMHELEELEECKKHLISDLDITRDSYFKMKEVITFLIKNKPIVERAENGCITRIVIAGSFEPKDGQPFYELAEEIYIQESEKKNKKRKRD